MTVLDLPARPLVVVEDTTKLARPDWLEARKPGIGGSDAAAICGQDSHRSAFEVWLDKTGALELADTDSEAAEWGRRLEPVVRDAVAEKRGLRIEPYPVLLAHPDRRWQMVNLDGLVLADEIGVYEGKTAHFFKGGDWSEEKVPDGYLIQGQHALAVTGLPYVLYGALIGGQRLVIRRVDRDDDLIEHLNAIEADFWQRVVDGTPPEPDGSDATTDFLAHLWDVKPDSVTVLDPAEVGPLLDEYRAAQQAEAAVKKRKTEAGNRLRVRIGDAAVAQSPDGEKLFSWKPSTKEERDCSDLEAEHPEIQEMYVRDVVTRRLHVPKPKEHAQ